MLLRNSPTITQLGSIRDKMKYQDFWLLFFFLENKKDNFTIHFMATGNHQISSDYIQKLLH